MRLESYCDLRDAAVEAAQVQKTCELEILAAPVAVIRGVNAFSNSTMLSGKSADLRRAVQCMARPSVSWSPWSSHDFGPAWVFARYDRVKPSKDLDLSLKDTYYNLDVAFPVADGVRITVAHKNERLRDNARTDNKTSEPGTWAR